MQSNASAYDYYFNDLGFWNKTKKSIKYALESQDWDIITIQQVSQDSGRPETFQNLQNILDYINQYKKNPDAKIYWHMTWAYQTGSTHSGFANYSKDQIKMYNAITSAAQNILKDYEEIEGIIPSGTAIQNLRTSYIGDKLTRDGYHLSYTTGRFAAGLTWFRTLTGLSIDELDFSNVEGLEFVEADWEMLKEAVNNAYLNPYGITQSQYTEK
jgi:hypothetical protein